MILLYLIIAALVIFGIYKFAPSFFMILGNIAFSKGNIEKTTRHFEIASRIFGGNPKAKALYALMLMRQEKFDEAEQVLNEIIIDDKIEFKNKISAKTYRCMLYQKTGRLSDAIADAEELFKKVKNTAIYGMLGYLKLLEGGANLEFCLEAYDYNSDDRDICDNLVLAYIRSGEYEKAENLLESLREGYPTFTEAFYHSALLAKLQGDKESAKRYLDCIEHCNRNGMTTVTDDDILLLKEELENA